MTSACETESIRQFAEDLAVQSQKAVEDMEGAIKHSSDRLDALQRQVALLAAAQRRAKSRESALEEALQRERERREAMEVRLLDCEEERNEFKSKVIDLKVERQALRCRTEELQTILQRAPAPSRPPGPRLAACRHHVPHGSKRYEDIVGMLHFIAENISLDRCAAMELQGRLVLHDDIVTLGRVLQWKLDFKRLDRLYISIPAEDADAFIGLVKQVIQSQKAAADHSLDESAPAPPAVDAETIGQIAAQWKIINDATIDGSAPTIYILNEVTRRAIIIGDWPHSAFSPDSKAGLDYRALYQSYKAADGASTRRVTDLSSFLIFMADNINLTGVVLFEPSRSQIILQDRETYIINLGRFRRYRLNAGQLDGLFVSVPEEDSAMFEAGVRSVRNQEATPSEVAQLMAPRWRALSPLHNGRRSYVLNEEASRVMIVDSWPDDSVLACTVMPILASPQHHPPSVEGVPHQPESPLAMQEVVAPPDVEASRGVGSGSCVVPPERGSVEQKPPPRQPVGPHEPPKRTHYHFHE